MSLGQETVFVLTWLSRPCFSIVAGGVWVHVVPLVPSTLTNSIINPRRVCAARLTVLGLCVCLSVCLCSVCPLLYSRISRNYAANKRYERLQRHMGSKKKKVRALFFLPYRTLGRPFWHTCTLCVYRLVFRIRVAEIQKS